MKKLLYPIQVNEVSFKVQQLHLALAALGMPIPDAERMEKKAGEATIAVVRGLQQKMNLTFDDRVVLDAGTAAAIERELKARGILSDDCMFTVSGKLVSAAAESLKQTTLIAFDVDLKGAAISRKVETLDEISKHGGFELLGETLTGNDGFYSLTFHCEQFKHAERKKADVVVYAVREKNIIGRSRMVNSADYSDIGEVRNLDIVVGKTDKRTEYEKLMNPLIRFLKESQVSIYELSKSKEQIAFAAGELDADPLKLAIAAEAEKMNHDSKLELHHQLLYALGRMNYKMELPAFASKTEKLLEKAIEDAVFANIISPFDEKEVAHFISKLLGAADEAALHHGGKNLKVPLGEILSYALPKKEQQTSFLAALRSFKGENYAEFWSTYLPSQEAFIDKPELISGLLFTQQLTLITGNYLPLVDRLQKVKNMKSAADLLKISDEEWRDLIQETGVPNLIIANSDDAKVDIYATQLQRILTAAFPTQKVGLMLEKKELLLENDNVSSAISSFLQRNPSFDISKSRVYDFEKEVKVIANGNTDRVMSELMRVQRVFQASPSPEVMPILLKNNLDSARAIASVPQKTFVRMYAGEMGGDTIAYAVHQRASYINTRSEMTALHMMEASHSATPALTMTLHEHTSLMTTLENKVPNYAQLFGSPDICECQHCRSVYGAAAYFVDLMRFLWRGMTNHDGNSPLDMLTQRRPDLVYLPLTCDNTDTLIPYVDLVNEIMEHYTVNGSLTTFKGYDTSDISAAELRADPQNFNINAYKILKNSKYPFSLPYHQPLDVIRSYGGHLKTSRRDAMIATQKSPLQSVIRATEAETLKISPEEYIILARQDFAGIADATPLHAYFGYANAVQLEQMAGVREFLARSGVKYTDLVDLINTKFINPHQKVLDFLEELFSASTLSPVALYDRLERINDGTLLPSADAAIMLSLNTANITSNSFRTWVQANFSHFNQIVTLYQSDSLCDLDTTFLRTVGNVYTNIGSSGLNDARWSSIHRFIRLWRKLALSIHETDLLLTAIGEVDISVTALSKLSSIMELNRVIKRPLNQTAVIWGDIDTYGKKSLYRKLFLNKTVMNLDASFEADEFGNFLSDNTVLLADHIPAILAAFRMSQEDLDAILSVATVIDAVSGAERLISLATDKLSLVNLSIIYRFVVLSKALKYKVPEFCLLLELMNIDPFSTWNHQTQSYSGISPETTVSFCELALAVKQTGFKPATLQYIFTGQLPADSTLGLQAEKAHKAVKAIREIFTSIEQDHPDLSVTPITVDILRSKLSLTFNSEPVNQLISILEGTIVSDVITTANLVIALPAALTNKYNYIKASGRLTCIGIMTDAEKATLLTLDASLAYAEAVDQLYKSQEDFLANNFSGVFTANMPLAWITLLDHPAQAVPSTIEEKLQFVYSNYLPLLKQRLREEAIIQHIAALTGLTDEGARLLSASYISSLVSDLTKEGYSATYYSDTTWTTIAHERTDALVNFDWGVGSPDAAVPANNFSARWEAYLAPSSSTEYTFIVEVDGADEAFKLFIDGILVLEKLAGNVVLSWETLALLNASQMHKLTLEYAETSGNAAVKLLWRTATTASEFIPATALFPAKTTDAFKDIATIHHRAAKFITGFNLDGSEVGHFINYKADFGNIDFVALTSSHWKRVNDYVSLRKSIPQAQAKLTDVFTLANRANPVPTVNELKDLLSQATAWDSISLEYFVNTHFLLPTSSFKNEIDLLLLRDAISIVSKTGIAASTIAEWGRAETDFDVLFATAQLIKSTVKAKYEEEDWMDVAGKLSDKIRENQKQALISHLLTQQNIIDWGAKDADGLFEYFLIDVQMGTCMETSRIVQANAAVQMFVNRCLLNMESDRKSGNEKGVSPESIDADRWEWMKSYRVWEANRKVFLYPENWLEPEWRNDRSETFKALESELVQNDISDRSVETAFRNYLTSLNEMANLDVVGMYQQNDVDGSLKLLHVFARTHNAPYTIYYRTWNEYMKWSAWEKVQVDVRNVEEGDTSGVHLVPVIWKNRLFLFWPEFIEKKEAPSGNKTQTAKTLSEKATSTLEAKTYWEIRLAWTEKVEGKWTPKQLSKEHIYLYKSDGVTYANYSFSSFIDNATNELSISMWSLLSFAEIAHFNLTDIQSKVDVVYPWFIVDVFIPMVSYQNSFEKRIKDDKLILKDDTYLNKIVNHRLLGSNNEPGFEYTIENPFFYHDSSRTYFVRPVEISILERVSKPEFHYPIIPGIFVDDSWYTQPHLPEVGPDDYIPGDILVGGGFTDPIRFTYGNYGVGDFLLNPQANMAGRNGINSINGDLSFEGGMPVGNTMPMALRTMNYSDGPQSPGVGSSSFQYQYMDMYKPESLGVAFGKYPDWKWKYPGNWNTRKDTGLEFHTFYHPYSTEFVTRLNRHGVKGLLESDTVLPSDEGVTFEEKYDPVFTSGFVQKPSDFSTRTYFKQNVCFDVYGANSLYNWELFFHAPLYIATRLSKNGQYKEAMKWFHFIFDPTTDELPQVGQSETSRYWKVLPFKTNPQETLEEFFLGLSPNNNRTIENLQIGEWRDSPFDPHLIASNRPLAYMKHVVVKYVENLLEWGDFLFRQFTRESVYEALQLYVTANHIMGPKPEFVPKRGEIKAESYNTLKGKLDDFSNAIVQLENLFPYSSEISTATSTTGPNLLGVGESLYFCIPNNEKLLEYWDRAADRLYKIRHCMDINGVERKLALFAPPIDPAALIQAASKGLSLGSILSALSSPPPVYRFTFLIQKTNEFCAEVKMLGNALLSVLEKKDAEELNRLRSTHEKAMLELITGIKQRQILEAKANRENLGRSRATAEYRLSHYNSLLGNEGINIPASPTIPASLTADSSLPGDTQIAEVITDADVSLADTDEAGIKIIKREKQEIEDMSTANTWQQVAAGAEGIGGALHFIPDFSLSAQPVGVGGVATYGGSNVGAGVSGLAKIPQIMAGIFTHSATQAARMAGYIRREQDWVLQLNLAAKEIIQLDKQITAADLRIQVTGKELENHLQQITNAEDVKRFLEEKFTNQELYQWMKDQLFAIYKQSYNMAFDMAKKTEKAYQYEIGNELASFVQYGYWENSYQGLLAGEKLQMALRQMEKSYIEENKRELELRKHFSMAMLNPLALQELRTTGKCYLSLPEELYDMDFQGHYFRRLKSVSVSIPCIAGPLTTISCTLRLLNNSMRSNTSMNEDGNYEHMNDEGIWIDDDRFRSSNVPIQSIAVSSGQSDSGMFELNFRDERYLPFEGAGAISDWKIELTADAELRQFDYNTISDIILHVSYTAREDAGLFKEKATTYIKSYLTNVAELSVQPLMRMFSMKHEFPTEWYRFLNPAVAGSDQSMSVTFKREHFPFFTRERRIDVMQVDILANTNRAGDYHLLLSITDISDTLVDSSQISMPENLTYGNIQKVTLRGTAASISVEDIDIFKQVKMRFKHSSDADYHSIDTSPVEIENIFLVVHYKLGDL